MTDHDRGSADEEVPDPWAPGGVMSSIELRPVDETVATPGSPHGPTSSPDPTPRRRIRPLVVVAALLCVAGTIAAASVFAPDRGSRADDDEAAADPTPRGQSTRSDPATMPAPTTTARETTSATGTTSTSAAGAAEFVVEDLTAAPASGRPRLDIITVESLAAEVAPTEIVALSDDGELLEIALPSGRLRTTDLDISIATAEFAVNDGATIVWPESNDVGGDDEVLADIAWRFTVVPAGGTSLPLVGPPTTGVRDVVSTSERDEFVVLPRSLLRATGTAVSAERSGGPTDPDRLAVRSVDVGTGEIVAMDPSGALLSQDTGGVYRLDESGTRRISGGDVLATGRNHVLLRECDERRRCSLTTIDRAGSTTVFDADLDERAGLSPLRNGLSPDGTAVLAKRSGAIGDYLVIVRLADGAVQVVHASPTFETNGAWAVDGSGVFYADGDLRFHRRSDGQSSVVAEALSDVGAVAARRPRTSALCDILVASAARFEEMRQGDDQVNAPPSAWLRALSDWSPDDMSATIEPLVRFAGTFVSAVRPGSRRPENWPADVRQGVNAIAAAAEDCATS